jgi:hypothetical protein
MPNPLDFPVRPLEITLGHENAGVACHDADSDASSLALVVEPNKSIEVRWEPEIVSIEECEQLPGRRVYRAIPCCRRAFVGCAAQDFEPVTEFLRGLDRPIRRAIVRNDDFPIVVGLGRDGCERLGEIRLGVVGGDDDADAGQSDLA